MPANKKIAILKVVVNLTGLTVAEAKYLVEPTPLGIVKEVVSRDAALKFKQRLEAAGAKVSVIPSRQ